MSRGDGWICMSAKRVHHLPSIDCSRFSLQSLSRRRVSILVRACEERHSTEIVGGAPRPPCGSRQLRIVIRNSPNSENSRRRPRDCWHQAKPGVGVRYRPGRDSHRTRSATDWRLPPSIAARRGLWKLGRQYTKPWFVTDQREVGARMIPSKNTQGVLLPNLLPNSVAQG
jgi:hypothetical protein